MTIPGDQNRRSYRAPFFEVHPLKTIVHAGATGGGDSGQTGFPDGDPTGDTGSEPGPFGNYDGDI